MLAKQQDKLKKKEILEQVKKWEEIQAKIRQKKQAVDAEHSKK